MAEGTGAKLVLVGTPLGNRGDLSPRARAAILGADLLLCEDTRSPRRLLGEGEELPRRTSCFVGNENERAQAMLRALEGGRTVVYVSEAGMPGVSDPGLRLVAVAVEAGFTVDVIPGPTAAATAFVHAGFVSDTMRFVGFLPRSGAERGRLLGELASERATTVFYEAPGRVKKLLGDLAAGLADAASRRAVVARELTKLHQEVLRGTVTELAHRLPEEVKGEITVVLEGCAKGHESSAEAMARGAARAVLEAVLDPALRPRERARRIAAEAGLHVDEVYERLAKR